MTNESIRQHCLGLPDVTEVVRWEDRLLFKVGGKMFAIIALDGHSCSLRCEPEVYGELVEMTDVVPASHNMWKYNWVTTQTLSALPDSQFRELLTGSYNIVRASLGKKARAALSECAAPAATPAARAGKQRVRARTAAAKTAATKNAAASKSPGETALKKVAPKKTARKG